jgi:hypothetical protein
MDNKPQSECKTCKKGLSTKHYIAIAFSFVILGTSIYGTVKLLTNIISYFTH